ncbi:MAG: hypothetical protein WAM28_01920 [Chlamydiales bacterium]
MCHPHRPIYDISKSYQENLEQGPFFEDPFPPRTFLEKNRWKQFLGCRAASLIGVPAGPLLNANWVLFAAKMGFDILTYKTIRSHPHPAHPLPNMVYVDTKGPLTPDRKLEAVYTTKEPTFDLKQLATTNSFGIPSQDSDYLIADIAKARNGLAEGQILIVSVVGSSSNFTQECIKASHLALEGGAQMIEIDLSCPNLSPGEGTLYTQPNRVFSIVSSLKKSIGLIPLIIKIGVIPKKETLKEVMVAAAKAGASAICGINTVSMKIMKEDGTPALGKNRLWAGVCGGPILPQALNYLQWAYAIKQEEKLDLTLMGTGGVSAPEHFDLFFEAGADVAMSAVGMMWNPYLAMQHHGQQT